MKARINERQEWSSFREYCPMKPGTFLVSMLEQRVVPSEPRKQNENAADCDALAYRAHEIREL